MRNFPRLLYREDGSRGHRLVVPDEVAYQAALANGWREGKAIPVVSEIAPGPEPDPEPDPAPKRRGRPRKDR